MAKLYTAATSGKNSISIFNAETGILSYKINLGNVEIVNGPVITQDKMTVVVRDSQGKAYGKVYTLPRGILSYSFQIS